jgi:hypothetical protein
MSEGLCEGQSVLLESDVATSGDRNAGSQGCSFPKYDATHMATADMYELQKMKKIRCYLSLFQSYSIQ